MDMAPRIIDSALVQAYAICDSSVRFTGKTSTYHDGRPVGKVPCLAICRNLRADDILLFYCSENWETFGTRGFESVEAAKKQAEIEYDGISSKWVNTKYTRDDLLPEDLEPKCSFCGAPYFEVEGLIEGKEAFICYKCAKKVSSVIAETDNEA
jgi:hypothetical protein